MQVKLTYHIERVNDDEFVDFFLCVRLSSFFGRHAILLLFTF